MPNTFDFEKILTSVDQNSLPPLHLWQPELSGDIDISIDAQGVWRHCGDIFTRTEIPKMFARIFVKEQGEYFLKTPVEKWRIKVADVPFYFVHYQQTASQFGPQLSFVSLTQDVVVLDDTHSLRIEINKLTEEPTPYISVRGNMEGKLCRSLYYQLVELAIDDEQEQKIYLQSGGKKYFLGSY